MTNLSDLLDWCCRTLWWVVLLVSATCHLAAQEVHEDFDVVIAGGSTAAFAAALSATEMGAHTALIEPTDWVGGQLTSSGVPAVDECWHRIVDPNTKKVLCDVAKIARDPRNMTPLFREMLLRTGNPGRGWVSRFCFEPRDFLCQELLPQEYRWPSRLQVFRNTVIKRADVDPTSRRIDSIDLIRRIARPDVAWGGYDQLPSSDLVDWYSAAPSPRFDKQMITIRGHASTVFVDATEWGELLVLSGASFLQGVDDADGSRTGDDSFGQCITFGFVQQLLVEPRTSADDRTRSSSVADRRGARDPTSQLGFGGYKQRPDRWAQVWTYRRIRATRDVPAIGDLSLQNWGYYPEHAEGGNDYPFGYLFLSRAEARAQAVDWRGGIDLAVLAAAEQRAFAWHDWFRHAATEWDPDQIVLTRGVLGTGHGLSKLPYIRDTRRSIGLDGFLLRHADLTGKLGEQAASDFPDRIALGCYASDIHRMADRKYPTYLEQASQPLPFTIPFRALTSESFDNLLVAGKTMSQSFQANAATRLHPIEWSTGTAAGVAAAVMAKESLTSRQMYGDIHRLQSTVGVFTPIDWTQ